MEKHTKGTKSNSRLNAKFVLVFSCVLFLAVILTFGVTLSYFGGQATGYNADFILKAGIEFKENESGTDYQALTFDSQYMIPGTSLTANCLVTITSGTADVANTAVNGLMRMGLSLSGDMAKFISLNYSEDQPIYVYKGTKKSDMTTANRIARLVQAQDGDDYFYLVDTDTTEILNTTMLYEIPCKDNNGVVSLLFDLPFSVTNYSQDGTQVFNNVMSGKTVGVGVDLMVIQSEFYGTSTDPLTKNYKNAITIFNDPVPTA